MPGSLLESIAGAVLESAEGRGVLVEPHADRHGGKLAVVADPTGAPFGLMEWADTDSKKEAK